MSKLNLALLVLLGAQLAFLIGDKLLIGDAHRPRVMIEGDRLFPALATDAIVELELRRDVGDTRLTRGAGGWVVASDEDVIADATMVETALDTLVAFAPGPVVAENAAKHVDFGVAGGDAIEVIARAAGGKEVARVIIGKATSDWRGVYARWPHDSDEVMLISGNVRIAFDKESGARGAWRDKTIIGLDALSIRGFEITKPDDEIVVIERLVLPSTEEGREGVPIPTEQDDWRLVRPVDGLMSRYAGNSLAATIADLDAERFHFGKEPLAELGLEPPVARVRTTLDNDRVLEIEIGDEVDSRRFVRVPGRDDIYVVPSYRLFGFLDKGKKMLKETRVGGGADEDSG